MAEFITALTDAGRALMADVVTNTDSIVFTNVTVGNGEYQASEKTQAALKARTSLKSLKETYEVSFTEQTSPLEVRLKSNIANYDPSTHTALFPEGFYVNEIGVMARAASGGTAILFMIAVVVSDQGDFLPHYEGSNPVEMVQDIVIKVNNDVTVTVTYSGSAYALSEDLSDHSGAAVASENGVHGLRYYNGNLQKKNGNSWETIETGSNVGLSVVNGKICQTYGTE